MDAPFNHAIFNQPLTYKALRRLALAIGWSENKTQGKGSHRTFTRKGYREITLPCHSERHEYQRGQTRQFLKQILEPLADVCHVPVQGIHSVEQVEVTVTELLEYLPSQVQREYEQAIAEVKSVLKTYEAEQIVKVDDRIQQYEAQRLQDCEQTIQSLESEHQSPDHNSFLIGYYILQHALITGTLKEQYQDALNELSLSRSTEKRQGKQLQLIEQELQTLRQDSAQRDAIETRLNQSLQDSHEQVKRLHKNRKRDRILMFVFLGISVCLGAVLIYQDRTKVRSPQSLSRTIDIEVVQF